MRRVAYRKAKKGPVKNTAAKRPIVVLIHAKPDEDVAMEPCAASCMGVKIKKVNHVLSITTAHTARAPCKKSQEQTRCVPAAAQNKRSVGQASEGKGPVTWNTFKAFSAAW